MSTISVSFVTHFSLSQSFHYYRFLVSKPSNNNNGSSHHHAPPPRPAPPVAYQAPLIDESDDSEEEVHVESAPPTTEFDFLNLGGGEKPPLPEPPKLVKVKEPSFDLLGGFDSNFSDPFPDLVGSAMNKPTPPIQSKTGGLDDIFGSLPQSTAPMMAPSKSSSDLNGLNLNFNAKPEEPKNATADPFADLTKSLHPEWNAGAAKASPTTSATATPRNNPSTPIHQMKSPSEPQRPDYSRSHFQDNQQQGCGGAGAKPKSADIFGDILGSQGYSFGSKMSQGPRSINDMRKVEMAQTMDPERLKVMEWVSCARHS